jgi:hypothetical protein
VTRRVNETILSLMGETLHADYTYVAVGNVSDWSLCLHVIPGVLGFSFV